MKAIAVILLFLLAHVAVARHISFVLNFRGRIGEAVNNKADVRLKAMSEEFRTRITVEEGVFTERHDIIGASADWHSTLTYIDATSFTDMGNVTFGTHQHSNHGLLFITDTEGKFFPAPPKEKEKLVGTATYEIVGGMGAWKGAAGTLVGSFVAISANTTILADVFVTANFWV